MTDDQNTAAATAVSPDPVDLARYDYARHAPLPGVLVPLELQGHMRGAPSPGIPVESAPAVEPEPEPEPVKAPEAAPVVREPAPEPASDGQFANAWRAVEDGRAYL